MLDSKVYRAAFVPVVFAIVVAAFALAERPRPIGTTLAPDAFDGRGAFRILSELARTYPRTRPGSAGDDALAERVERDLRAALEPEGEVSGSVRVERTTGETIDGEQRLTTVIGERPGLNRRRIVIVAHRDRAAEDDRGRLSGTAALLELARLYRGRPTRRSLVFVSTSGGTGGLAALRDLPEQLGGPVDAVLVIGDVATRREERPLVLPWSEHGGFAPMRLRRTVERALQLETDLDPGSPRALAQWARLAVPLTLTPQGALGGDGLSAVTIQASGERGPAPGAAVSRGQFQAFGRGTLRSISALDNGPDVPSGPREYVLFRGRVLPRWTVSLIAALLLLPALVASVDGLARVRRRHQRVAVWLRWLAAAAAPFALAALIARLLGLVGLVPSLPGPVDPAALPTETAAIVVLGLVVVLGFLARAPLARALGAPSMPHPDEVPGASAALGVALTVLGICVWALNPYTALLLVPAVHLWLLAAVPEVRLPRLALVGMVLAGLLPFALVASYYAGQFDLNLGELAWHCVVLLSGGTVGPLGALAWSAVLGCGVGALLLALRKPRVRDEGPSGGPPSTRGPLSYAGPGSLGGTESALRR